MEWRLVNSMEWRLVNSMEWRRSGFNSFTRHFLGTDFSFLVSNTHTHHIHPLIQLRQA
jgi:hypothetical protein